MEQNIELQLKTMKKKMECLIFRLYGRWFKNGTKKKHVHTYKRIPQIHYNPKVNMKKKKRNIFLKL